MKDFTVSVNAARVLLVLENGGKRAAFAIRDAVNRTGRTVQVEVREKVEHEFTTRSPFLARQVKFISAKLSTGVIEARVGIGIGQRLSGAPLLLPGFEEGATREPRKGALVAVPVEARPSKPQVIPEALWIQRLQLRFPRSRRQTPGAVAVRRGLQRTFQVPGLGILQRVGTGVTRLLYAFMRPFKLDRRLEFYKTAQRVVRRDYAANLRREIMRTFRHQLTR